MKATTLVHLSAATTAGRDSTESLFRGALVLVDLSFAPEREALQSKRTLGTGVVLWMGLKVKGKLWL